MTHDETPARLDEAGPRIRLGVSSCLLGEKVRATGGHSRDAFLVKTLGRWVDWVPVCPEVEMGMGTPRPPLRLVRSEAASEGGARRRRASWHVTVS